MRPLITASSIGFCYLLHFSAPLGNLTNVRAQAQHYSGWCEDLETRIAQHLAGEGSKITRAAVAQGIEISLVATWRAPLSFEKYLKRRKDAPRLCPICCRERGRRVRHVDPMRQLTLDLSDPAEDWIEPTDLPAVPSQMRRGEVLALQRWSKNRQALVERAAGDDWDEDLL